MSVFKTRRGKLLPIAILLAVLLVWQPWAGLEPHLRGIKMGADVAGGSRTVFDLQASRVTIQVTTENNENLINNLLSVLEINLEASTRFISYDSNSGHAVFDVDRYLTMPVVQKAVTGFGTVVSVVSHVEDNTRESAISSLKTRIDPYDILGTQLRSFGKTSIIFEASGMDPNNVSDLLGKQGKLEVIIDNQLVFGNNEVESIASAVAVESAAYVPITLTKSGTEMLKSATSGKTNHIIVIYLDRPSDAILVFDNDILKNTSEVAYDEASRTFYVSTERALVRHIFYISVSALPINRSNIPQASLDYLAEQISDKTRIVLLGTQTEFSAEVIRDISANYQISSIPRRNGESVDDWILRACGVESTPAISQTMAAGGVTEGLTLPFIEKSSTASLQKAQNFYKIITNGLAVPISFEYETTVGPILGEQFLSEAPIAGGVAILWTFVILYLAYQRFKVVLALLAFALADVVLALGAISVFSLTLGLPALAGLLFVLFTSLNQNIIITNEMLKGVQPQEKVSVGWRASRALSIVYIAIFTTIIAAALTAFLGFGAVRMFAIVAAVGMTIAFFLSRPIFARVIESALARSPKKEVVESGAKPEQKKQ